MLPTNCQRTLRAAAVPRQPSPRALKAWGRRGMLTTRWLTLLTRLRLYRPFLYRRATHD